MVLSYTPRDAHDSIGLLEELVYLLKTQGGIRGRRSVMALEKLVENWGEVGH